MCSFFCRRKSGKGTYALQIFRCPYQTFPCEKTCAHAPLFKKDKPGKGTYALQIFRSPYQAFLLTRGRALVCFLKEKPGKGTYVLQIFNCPYRVVYKTKTGLRVRTLFLKNLARAPTRCRFSGVLTRRLVERCARAGKAGILTTEHHCKSFPRMCFWNPKPLDGSSTLITLKPSTKPCDLLLVPALCFPACACVAGNGHAFLSETFEIRETRVWHFLLELLLANA